MPTTLAGESATSRRSALSTSRAAPVLIWAALGLTLLSVCAYAMGSWMLSPHFAPVDVGSTPIPAAQLTLLRIVETACAVLAGSLLLIFVVKPLIQKREFSWDGLYLISIFLLVWLDPIDNYVNYSFMYNSHLLNMGSWAAFIPGFGYPNHEKFPEPILFVGGFYIFGLFGVAYVGSKLLGWSQRRWPQASTLTRIACLFAVFCLFDIAAENLFVRTGAMAYPATIHALSINAGEPYQWPLYEALLIGSTLTGFACFHYFRDDKGQCLAEKGLDRLSLPKPAKKLLSFLAISGLVQIWFILVFFVPYNALVIQADTAPGYPSYMRNGICGEGTQYACPSRQWVPIPRVGTQLYVRPDDPRLPADVRAAQSGKPYGFFSE